MTEEAVLSFVKGAIKSAWPLELLLLMQKRPQFWVRSGDRLFVKFAAAFWLLALNRVVLAAVYLPQGDESWPYLLRLIAFGLIAVAILQKNTTRRPRLN